MLSSNKEIGQVILFLSKYPQSPEEYRDGFFQRVENIDNFFKEDERIYLSVSLFKNFKPKIAKHGLRTEVNCNFFLHFIYILKLFKKSSFVYIQSIYNALNLILFIFFIHNFYILDLHGVVPEELKLQHKMKYAIIFSVIENILFKKVNVCIAVTNRMADHFKCKYPLSNTKYIIYSILPSHLKPCDMSSFQIKDEEIKVIYSGNAQVWQNIDLMLDAIKKNQSIKINFTILTGEPKIFKEKLKSYNIENMKITIKSVKPTELEGYYLENHYGFVLRDDILVNRVACPTKIIEYLNYGIIPIVLSEKIGDFENYGYEYIYLHEFNDQLNARKSLKNVNVIHEIFENNNFNLKSELNKLMV